MEQYGREHKMVDNEVIRRVNDKLINKEPTEAVLHGN